MNASSHAELYIAGTCCPSSIFIGNVVFHASIHVDLELNLLDRTSKTRIILASVQVISIVLGIVNVLFWPIYTEPFFRNFKLASGISKGQETKDPDLDVVRKPLRV